MPTTPSPWVPQGNGRYLPSAELLARIRSNPGGFPHAVDDIHKMSGMSRSQVEDALWNPWRNSARFPTDTPGAVLRALGETGAALGRGIGEAGATALDKIGVGGDGVRYHTNFNPGFKTELGMHESVGEIVGEVTPAIGASVAAYPLAGAAGLTGLGAYGASAVAGALASTMTEKPEDSFFNVLNDLTKPGPH